MTRTRTVSGPNGVEVVEFTEAENAERDAEELAELGRLKPEAKAEIDRQAEAARQAFVTPGAAQQSVYLSKAAEAERLASDGSPDPADYPLLAASIGLEGATLAEVAAVVIAQRNAWVMLAATIEGERLGAKAAIDDLPDPPTVEAVAAIMGALSWPTP